MLNLIHSIGKQVTFTKLTEGDGIIEDGLRVKETIISIKNEVRCKNANTCVTTTYTAKNLDDYACILFFKKVSTFISH